MGATIRPGSGRAWRAAIVSAWIVLAVAGGITSWLIALISQGDTEGWGALGLAIFVMFVAPIAALATILLLIGFVAVMPRWAARLRSRAGQLWAAALVGAVAVAAAGLLVAIGFQLLELDANLLGFGAMLAGIGAVLGAIGGTLGWLSGLAGLDRAAPADGAPSESMS